MNDIFCEYLRQFILVFSDDILVYSGTMEDHVQHLQVVLEVLEAHQLFANEKNCPFSQSQLEYLGHFILGSAVAANMSKIYAMVDWSVPFTLRDLRGFLGLTGYYRHFVANYGSIAWLLTEQLKKDSLRWGLEVEASFRVLKAAMTSVPVLALPDFSKPFVVESEAPRHGIGAILMQDQRRIAYFSQVLPQ